MSQTPINIIKNRFRGFLGIFGDFFGDEDTDKIRCRSRPN